MIRRRLVKVTRRVPGYRRLRRLVLLRIQQSTIVRALVKQVFPLQATMTAPVDVTPGRVITGDGTRALPVIAVVMVGLPDEKVYAVVDEVAELQLLGAGFRPVLISDSPILSAALQFGYPLELLVSEQKWLRDGQGSWIGYVGSRISLAVSAYRASLVVHATVAGLDGITKAMLDSLSLAQYSTAG